MHLHLFVVKQQNLYRACLK